MKRDVIADLVRQGSLPWVEKLPETKPCCKVIRDRHLRTSVGCSLRASWIFTAGPESVTPGGPYCWLHLMPILTAGPEQVRIEDLLKSQGAV